MDGWFILAQTPHFALLFFIIVAEDRGEYGLVHHHHSAAVLGFTKTPLPPAFLLSFFIKSPLNESRAVSIRRACLESQQRRTKPLKKEIRVGHRHH